MEKNGVIPSTIRKPPKAAICANPATSCRGIGPEWQDGWASHTSCQMAGLYRWEVSCVFCFHAIDDKVPLKWPVTSKNDYTATLNSQKVSNGLHMFHLWSMKPTYLVPLSMLPHLQRTLSPWALNSFQCEHSSTHILPTHSGISTKLLVCLDFLIYCQTLSIQQFWDLESHQETSRPASISLATNYKALTVFHIIRNNFYSHSSSKIKTPWCNSLVYKKQAPHRAQLNCGFKGLDVLWPW